MNRQLRRAKAKATPAYKRGMTAEDKIKAFYKNGITIEDLERNHHIGYNEGWHAACDHCMKVCYAAAARAFAHASSAMSDEVVKLLLDMDSMVTYALSSDEAIDAAMEELGLEIDFRKALPDERISSNRDSVKTTEEYEHAI